MPSASLVTDFSLRAGGIRHHARRPAGLAEISRRDLRRGDPAEHDEVLANIARVPLPDADPVRGGEIAWV